jgi:hypothetical protein
MRRYKNKYSSHSKASKPSKEASPTSFIASINQTAPQPDSSSPDPKISSRKDHRKKNTKKLVLILVVVAGIVAASMLLIRQDQEVTPFPVDITAGLPYRVYYPQAKTSGYSYKDGTAKLQSGILFYTLANGSKKIFVTEQAVPSKAINLKSLPKHSPIDMPIGRAVIGTGLGNPSIVIITPTTLVQLTSSKGVTKTDIINVAQKLTVQNYYSQKY